ncbi:MAG: hypothetical protein R3F02_09970 [Thiolinea sp.]
MNKRKGVLGLILFLLIWIVPVSADESADEIVAMMSWWEEYGRYWEEMGVDSSLTSTDEDGAFAWLGNWFADPEAVTETRSSQ